MKYHIHKILTYGIALIWIINGLYCKLLNLVPRHEQIVAKILGHEHARLLTIFIGVSELLMAVWILSRFKAKLNAITQMVIIAAMNILEYFLAPELLLWGKLNAVFAGLLIVLIYINEFVLHKQSIQRL